MGIGMHRCRLTSPTPLGGLKTGGKVTVTVTVMVKVKVMIMVHLQAV
jgi:hypothetical protein